MLDIKTNRVQAIKAVRQFCFETFGVNSGLKETKDFIETMIVLQKEAVINRLIAELKALGYTKMEVEFAIASIYRPTF